MKNTYIIHVSIVSRYNTRTLTVDSKLPMKKPIQQKNIPDTYSLITHRSNMQFGTIFHAGNRLIVGDKKSQKKRLKSAVFITFCGSHPNQGTTRVKGLLVYFDYQSK
jgi:hypothetical protein